MRGEGIMAGYNTLSKEQLNEELVKLKEEYAKILESDISLAETMDF